MSVTGIRSDWAGRIVDGRFTLIQWLGGTDRSGVFLTELTGPQPRKAAIKLIQAEAVDADATMAGWAATRPLSHPHLMRLFHTGRCEMDGCALIFVVTEFADEILSEILPGRALTPAESKEMLEPVLDVLSYLHGKGLVHGHLRPSNVMVVQDSLKLSADGLQAAGETGRQSLARSIYLAPEAADGTVSPAADVWGLGVTLVEALTQHPPVWDESAASSPVVPESIPQPFAGIARGCLRADPTGRCTLGDVKNWLDSGQPVIEPSGGPEKKARAKNRVPVLVFAAVVLVAVFAVVELRSFRTEQSQPVASSQPDVKQTATSAPASPESAPQPVQDQSLPAAQASSPAQDETPGGASAPQAEQQAPAAVPSPQPPSPATHASKGPAADGAVAERVMPDVLPEALASIRGKVDVSVRVTVDAQGHVSEARFESEGPSRYFSNAALKAARNWKFKPAQADGQPAASVWIIQFHFTQAGTEVAPVAAH